MKREKRVRGGVKLRRLMIPFAMLPVLAFAADGVPQDSATGSPDAALVKVKWIYVDQLGGGKTSDQFRDMMIAAIQSSGLFLLDRDSGTCRRHAQRLWRRPDLHGRTLIPTTRSVFIPTRGAVPVREH